MAYEPETQTETTDAEATGSAQFLDLMIHIATRVWRVLEYSSAYLALIAVAEVGIVMMILSLPPSPAPVVVALICFAVYTNDRLADLESDSMTNPKRTAFVRRHREILYVLAALSYGMAVALSVLAGPVGLAMALLPGVAWVLYAIDWIPVSGIGLRRLKELFIVNSAVIALTWAATVIVVPLAFAEKPVDDVATLLFIYFALGLFIDTEVPNVRDVEGDRAIGIATMPVKLGVEVTQLVLYGINLALLGILGTGVWMDVLSLPFAVALGTGLLWSTGVVGSLGRLECEGSVAIAADFSRVPVFVALVVLTLLS